MSSGGPPTLLIPSLTDNLCILFRKVLFLAYTEKHYKSWSCPRPLLAPEGAASICIYVYLQYLEIVFVSGSM